MAKGKPRWEKVSAYELARDTLQGKAASVEAEKAGREVMQMVRRGGRPQASIAPGGKFVIR